jgi:hypothetical protein
MNDVGDEVREIESTLSEKRKELQTSDLLFSCGHITFYFRCLASSRNRAQPRDGAVPPRNSPAEKNCEIGRADALFTEFSGGAKS